MFQALTRVCCGFIHQKFQNDSDQTIALNFNTIGNSMQILDFKHGFKLMGNTFPWIFLFRNSIES
jgi:hypothetical protein